MAAKKSAAAPGRPHLVYVDECEVHTHPYLAQVWRRKGHAMKIPAAGEDHKFTIFGALDYASGQVIWQTAAHKGEDAFTAFLAHLAAQLPAVDEPVVLVLDNGITGAITSAMPYAPTGSSTPTASSRSSCQRTRRNST